MKFKNRKLPKDKNTGLKKGGASWGKEQEKTNIEKQEKKKKCFTRMILKKWWVGTKRKINHIIHTDTDSWSRYIKPKM